MRASIFALRPGASKTLNKTCEDDRPDVSRKAMRSPLPSLAMYAGVPPKTFEYLIFRVIFRNKSNHFGVNPFLHAQTLKNVEKP